MIVLDTHIWIWWVQGDPKLSSTAREAIVRNEALGLGISAMSCWEVAMLASARRVDFKMPLDRWFAGALGQYPGVRLLELTPQVAIESVSLPGSFHRDPSDRIIVATARRLDCPLVTADEKILAYPHVKTIA